jgi:hypothetical protein
MEGSGHDSRDADADRQDQQGVEPGHGVRPRPQSLPGRQGGPRITSRTARKASELRPGTPSAVSGGGPVPPPMFSMMGWVTLMLPQYALS